MGPEPSAATTETSQSSALMTFGDEEYLVSVRSEGTLTINCVRGCATPVSFSDDPAGKSIGLFRLTDNDNLLYTTWVGGSTYRLVIYAIDKTGPRKVLDEYSLAAPDILGSIADGPAIRLTQFISEASRRRVIRNWRWSTPGRAFVAKR